MGFGFQRDWGGVPGDHEGASSSGSCGGWWVVQNEPKFETLWWWSLINRLIMGFFGIWRWVCRGWMGILSREFWVGKKLGLESCRVLKH